MVTGISSANGLSHTVTQQAQDLTEDAALMEASLRSAQASGTSNQAEESELGLRLDMINTTLKNIQHASAYADSIFLSYRQAESLALNYRTDVAAVLAMGERYKIAIGAPDDPYSIGIDKAGNVMRMVIPVEGNGPGEYLETKIDSVDRLRNELEIMHPFLTLQHNYYQRDIDYSGATGNAVQTFYTDYRQHHRAYEDDSRNRYSGITLGQNGTGNSDSAGKGKKPPNWRSSA